MVEDDSCFVCGKPSEAKCSRCRAISYCGPECQRKDWKRHKAECGKAPVTAAADAGPQLPPASAAPASPASARSSHADEPEKEPAVASTAIPAKKEEAPPAAATPAMPSATKKKKERKAAEKAKTASPVPAAISHSGTPGKTASFDVVLSGSQNIQVAQRVIDILKERGVAVIKAGADRAFQKALFMESNMLWDGGYFGEAQKGMPSKPGSGEVKFDARDDKIIWMTRDWVKTHEKRSNALKVLDGQLTDFGYGLKTMLEEQLGLNLASRTPGMLACYAGEHAPGARYDYHIDNPFQTAMGVPDDKRRLTLLYYISDGPWDVSKDGGGLQVALSNPRRAPRTTSEALNFDKMTIAPECDTLVAFWSHTMYHAVLPVMGTRRRFALSAWFQCK